MIVRYGRSVEDGFLPVYSVDTEEEAQSLIVLTCPRNMDGELVAPELIEEQTLENLTAFGDRLDRAHDFLKQKGRCTCKKGPGARKG